MQKKVAKLVTKLKKVKSYKSYKSYSKKTATLINNNINTTAEKNTNKVYNWYLLINNMSRYFCNCNLFCNFFATLFNYDNHSSYIYSYRSYIIIYKSSKIIFNPYRANIC